MIIKAGFKLLFLAISLIVGFALFTNLWVVLTTRDQVYNDVDKLPDHDVALVLGTSKRLTNGKPNPFFYQRIEAAAELYQKRKVRHFILSGDNRSRYYNEPIDMKKALMELGVPDTLITLDYAGLRTLDSIVRCKEIFGQKNVTIITQEFHSYRALFISDNYSMKADVYSPDHPISNSFKVRFREVMARPKAVIDIFITKKQPKFMGEKESIKM
ncbi:SanA/YdcF family protein [Xanthovirga aplysinae]|uniref:SanA/YdcF family protein n=1 Tax=Xanthovirga aplysinae TaxID=2529853 RepID=UPI0012BC3CD2|nr:ElyC/SanA/YdcF family protein [Xanthovirga aplysinae]MTI32779.1 SanA protein [Xanthovirga aplysinae]